MVGCWPSMCGLLRALRYLNFTRLPLMAIQVDDNVTDEKQVIVALKSYRNLFCDVDFLDEVFVSLNCCRTATPTLGKASLYSHE